MFRSILEGSVQRRNPGEKTVARFSTPIIVFALDFSNSIRKSTINSTASLLIFGMQAMIFKMSSGFLELWMHASLDLNKELKKKIRDTQQQTTKIDRDAY